MRREHLRARGLCEQRDKVDGDTYPSCIFIYAVESVAVQLSTMYTFSIIGPCHILAPKIAARKERGGQLRAGAGSRSGSQRVHSSICHANVCVRQTVASFNPGAVAVEILN